LLCCLLDSEEDTFQIFHHIIVGESKDAISARYKPSVATIIVTNTFLEIVTFAVNLDDELAKMSYEVRDGRYPSGFADENRARRVDPP